MWKLIKSSYNATRGLVKFLGKGTELLVEGLNECDKGLEALNAKMETVSSELREVRHFKRDIHQLKLLQLTIKHNKNFTPMEFKISHCFYEQFNEIIDRFIDTLQIAIEKPKCRSVIQNYIIELKREIPSILNADDEWETELEKMYSNGLDKDANLIEVYRYAFRFYSKDAIEGMLNQNTEPELLKISNSVKEAMDNMIQHLA